MTAPAALTVCRSDGPEETEEIGRAIAPAFLPGDVVALSGDLGAGKTCLIRGIAAGLDVKDPVTSPTFVLVREYAGGRLPVTHVDVFRLRTFQELFDLGYDEVLEGGRLVLIEWGGAIEQALPEEHLTVEIRQSSETERIISFIPAGSRWGGRFPVFAKLLKPWSMADGAGGPAGAGDPGV